MSSDQVSPFLEEFFEFLRDPYGVKDGSLALVREAQPHPFYLELLAHQHDHDPQPAIRLIENLHEDVWDPSNSLANEAKSEQDAVEDEYEAT